MVANYGSEEEADAQEYLEQLQTRLLTTPRRALWHQDSNHSWHILACDPIQTTRFSYAQGKDLEQMRSPVDTDHPHTDLAPLLQTHLDELIHQIREKYQVKILSIPLDQWYASPDEQKRSQA